MGVVEDEQLLGLSRAVTGPIQLFGGQAVTVFPVGGHENDFLAAKGGLGAVTDPTGHRHQKRPFH